MAKKKKKGAFPAPANTEPIEPDPFDDPNSELIMGAPNKELMGALKRLHSSGDWSDLIISCGDQNHNVHKSIVCTRFEFFEAACRGGFKETHEDKINLENDDPWAVDLMIYYFYHLEYDVSRARGGAGDVALADGLGWELVAHANLYALAEKYGVGGLKGLALQNFATAVHTQWDSDSFLAAARHAYTSTVETDRGLRNIITSTFYKHRTLLNKQEVKEGMVEVPQMSLDLLMHVHDNCDYW